MNNKEKRILILLCLELNIKPLIIEETENKIFSKYYNKFVLEPKKRIIYLNNKILINKNNYDYIFALAHECRHQWQFDNNLFNRENYKSSDKFNNIEEYNSQFEELDANAFAYKFMLKYFGVKALFQQFSENLKQKIIERSEII